MDLSLPSAMRAETGVALAVRAPGRLHLGFLDPSATLGRRFGSIGLVIDGFETELEIAAASASDLLADTPAAQAELDRAAACLHTLREHTGLRQPLRLRLIRTLPAHAGFGSGTQLALAIGRAFVRWHRLEVSTPTLAAWLGRGLRSGVGIAGFDQGGLLVDGGPAADGAPAALLSRVTLPEAWRVVIVQDARQQGLSGGDERHAIANLPPLPQAQAADICHQVLMRVLPGAAGGEFVPFAAGINQLQDLLGAHFAPAQGGTPWTSAAVGDLMHWIRGHAPGGAATGQSSWGPTGFAIVPSQPAAQALVDAAHAAGALDPALAVRIVAARNRGATVADARVR